MFFPEHTHIPTSRRTPWPGGAELPREYSHTHDPFVALTAAALPEISADFRRFTIRIQPGIFFADDPAFQGQKRELVADDYVYSLKRFADPANKSPATPNAAAP